MSFRIRLVATAFAATASASQAAAQFVQVPLPYNADVVREVGGTTTGGGIDSQTFRVIDNQPVVLPGGRAFVTQSEAAAHDPLDPRGLPDNGVLQVPGGTLQLGPYDGNNALRFGNFGVNRPGFGVSLGAPGTYRSFQIYAAGGNSNPLDTPRLQIRLQRLPGAFTGGSFDWKREPPPGDNFISYSLPISGLDTTGPEGGGFEDVDGAQIVRWSYELSSLDQQLVSGFTITLGDPGTFNYSSVSILGITLTPVPEPSAAMTLGCAAPLLLARRRRAD